MTPSEIENRLQHGALRRGWPLGHFRALVERIAELCELTFEQALWCVSRYDEDGEKWQKFLTEYQTAQDEAAQLGCSVDQLVKAYARLNSSRN